MKMQLTIGVTPSDFTFFFSCLKMFKACMFEIIDIPVI